MNKRTEPSASIFVEKNADLVFLPSDRLRKIHDNHFLPVEISHEVAHDDWHFNPDDEVTKHLAGQIWLQIISSRV